MMKMMDAYEEGMIAGAIITVENLRDKHLISDKVADALIKAAKEFHFSSAEEKKLGKEYWGSNREPR